jgi:hypothetical protein
VSKAREEPIPAALLEFARWVLQRVREAVLAAEETALTRALERKRGAGEEQGDE